MKIGDLVRVPKAYGIASYIGIIIRVNNIGGVEVTSLCGQHTHWLYESNFPKSAGGMKLEVLA